MLTGFMGSGKSTVGPLVAESLGWPFYDTDVVLEATHSTSIPAIFTLHGEARFRELEEQVIGELLARDPAVIALGGGALESAATRARLVESPRTHIVFLDAPLEVALGRCAAQTGTTRPLLAGRSRLEERYRARLPFYQTAHQTIDTAKLLPDQAALAITSAVQRDQPPTSAREWKP